MSYEAETTMAHDRADRGSADSVAGFMASFAIFLSFIGIFWHPLRLIVPSLIVALVASGMARGKLQLAAVLIGAVCLFLGLALQVSTGHALW